MAQNQFDDELSEPLAFDDVVQALADGRAVDASDLDEKALANWPVLESISTPKARALYVRLPTELQRPINGGCVCRYCVAHPDQVPAWDTLAIPLPSSDHSYGATHTWTVHAPDAD